jgi:hypothetical protein
MEGNATPEPLLQHEHNLELACSRSCCEGRMSSAEASDVCRFLLKPGYTMHVQLTRSYWLINVAAATISCESSNQVIQTQRIHLIAHQACLSVAGLPGLIAGDTR